MIINFLNKGGDTEAAYQSGYTAGEIAGYDSGWTEGMESGLTEGFNDGYSSGNTDGYATGYASGESDGYATGEIAGKIEGYDSGYTQGYEEAGETTQAMIDGSISSITISTDITTIRPGAFKDTNLTSVVIPASVTAIGDGAFDGCSGLTSITLEGTTPPTIEENTFSGSTCPIYVPNPQTYEDEWSAYTGTTPRIQDGSVNDPLTFVVVSGGTIQFRNDNSFSEDKVIEYSKNGGAWTSIHSTAGTEITVAAGDTVKFRGDNAYYANDSSDCATFDGTAYFTLRGYLTSLIDSTGYTSMTTLPSANTFCGLFKNTNVTDASNLNLGTTGLSKSCYDYLFFGCTHMTQGPDLPATTIPEGAYNGMFQNCYALTVPPIMSATTLLDRGNCVAMFMGCQNLETSPEIKVQTVLSQSFQFMFHSCSKLKHVTCLATSFEGFMCTWGWMTSVSGSGTFVKASGMTSWETGANGIPNGWDVVDYGSTPTPTPSYSPVEYIRSNGGSWNKYEAIDTGIYPSTGLTLRIVYGGRGEYSGRLCGVSWEDMHDSYDESYDAEQFMRFFPHFAGNFFDLNGGRLTVNDVDLTGWTTHDFTLGNFYIKSGSTVLTSDTAYSTLSYTGHPIMVDVSCINLEGFEIYDGNTCVFSGVPAYISGETPVVGLYDSVSDAMFTNTAVTFVYSSGGSEYTANTESGGDEPTECPEGMHWDEGAGDCVMDDVPDPCEGYATQEECDCAQQGGVWDAAANEGLGECTFPEGE